MRRDVGSRDAEFVGLVQAVRATLVDLAAPRRHDRYTTVLLPGSGTYAVEATLGTCVPARSELLIASNVAYGDRMEAIAERLAIPHSLLRVPDHIALDPRDVEAAVEARPGVTHLAVVHCETTTGLLNPLARIAELTRERGLILIADAMSSFGALPIDMDALGIQLPDRLVEPVSRGRARPVVRRR